MSAGDDPVARPADEDLAAMSTQELVQLGGRMDGVETVLKESRWPVEGTRAEKRAERGVALWLLFAGAMGFALLLAFLFWPWQYKPNGAEGNFLYTLATPIYGVTFGLSILAIGVGAFSGAILGSAVAGGLAGGVATMTRQ